MLRLLPGASVELIDAATGTSYLGCLAYADKDGRVEISAAGTTHAYDSRVRSLLFALAKSDHNDLVAEKLSELGVENLVFFQAERSIVRAKDQRWLEERRTRLARIAEAAARQSMKTSLTAVTLFEGLPAALAHVDSLRAPVDCAFLCSLDASARPFSELLGEPASAHVAIGPEGDLTPGEQTLLAQHGFVHASLGPFRLRSETAAIVAVSAIQALWGIGR